MASKISFFFWVITISFTLSCQKKEEQHKVDQTIEKQGSFGYDLKFLTKYKSTIVLTAPDDENARAIIVAGYQGRVMTTTAGGNSGDSYGWINYDLIQSGVYQPHMNAFGGEERFWLSPEGGQFSVFFKKGQTFDFKNWQTPALIDTVTYNIVGSDSSSVSFQMNTIVENYSGTKFVIEINRKIAMLDKAAILASLGINSLGKSKSVAYESANEIVNMDQEWKPETGTLGIWLLGMFRPTDKTVIIAPFSKTNSEKLLLTDDYFGKIPGDRIVVKNSAVFLKADGKFRSKIGLAPKSARNVAGSYDTEKGVLTIIQYHMDSEQPYLKSGWEIHDKPYAGDVLNAYNDGKLDDGTQMGPFYELESNSSTKALKKGEKLSHKQRTFHFEGDKVTLDHIATKVLGVKLDQIGEIFK